MDLNFRRLLDTLAAIPPHRKISTSEIRDRLKARGHDVTMRTLQRDLDALAGEFGLERDDGTKPYGWKWPNGVPRISLPEMDWPVALSFYLLRQHLEGLLPASVLEHLAPYFAEAEKKLRGQFQDIPLKRWPEKVRVALPGQPLRSPAVLRAVRDTVTEALLSERQLDIRYRRPRDTQPQTWRIHALGLVQRGGVFYLAVRVADYQDVRTIVMHRIERATMLPDAVQVPKGFSLDRWLEEGAMGFGDGGSLRLVADFHEGAGRHLLESPLSENQKTRPLDAMSDSLRVSATVRDTEQLRWWLLGFGGKVEVIGPAALRRDIASRLRAAVKRYARKPA
jgi:predicted DNA-binding transcriptional regulator YafY